MKFNKIIIICIAALILAVTPVVIAEVQRSAPITVKTELNNSEVLPEVELSRGKLYFKKHSEILDGLTAEEREEIRTAGLELMDATVVVDIREVIEQEELEQAMNIYPEYWNICGKIGEPPYLTKSGLPMNLVIWKEQNKVGLRGAMRSGTVFTYYFAKENRDYTPYIIVKAGVADAKWLDYKAIRAACGHRGSLIGEVPLAISYFKGSIQATEPYGDETVHMYAEMVLGETRYMVESIGFTQREFIDFLISLYEAPRPEKRDIVTYILDNNSELKEEVENILNGNT